nr:immunoglobulin light chain junction region [Macaca mulatta]MPN82695.1 immunoglobulin light chain junction region [Macaca mulatta]MPN83212.1 immunoglobulin light chain junction region [Macaca mulatta]
CRQYNSDPLTF